MGRIAQYVKAVQSRDPGLASTALAEGGRMWREVFGAVNKEDPRPTQAVVRPAGWGNSFISNAAAGRLLQALRSRSPGGWSDNRYEQASHYVGITFVAVFRLARMMSQAEFQVFKEDPTHPDGKRPVSKLDPPEGGRMFVRPWDLVELLKNPNPVDTFGKMLMRLTIQKYLTGTSLNWMVPNTFGVPMELYPIETAIAQPQPVINAEYPDGFYRIQPVYPNGPFSSYPVPNSAAGAIVPARWMIADRFPHPFLRHDGYAFLTGLRLHIDEVESMDRSRWHKMKRSIHPSAILQMLEAEGMQPLSEEEIARIKAEWENEFMGPENWGKIVVGSPGCEVQLQNDAEEIDYYQGWEQLVSFVMGGFGITKEACGMISDASYAALFATLKQLHLITLDPECQDLGQLFTRQLCHFFGDDLTVEVRCKRIDDHEITFNKVNTLQQARAITKNEVRKALDFPLTQEPWGNDIAGDPSPNETLMQTQLAMAALPDEAEEQATGQIKPGGLPREEQSEPDPEPAEITQTRPNTGSLGRGSKGPQGKAFAKSYLQHRLTKVFDKYIDQYATNGNGNGRHA